MQTGVLVFDIIKKLFRNNSVAFIEPRHSFEQLEERIVLDATVDKVVVDGATVASDATAANQNIAVTGQVAATTDVKVEASSSNSGNVTYSLTADGMSVADYNASHSDRGTLDITGFETTGVFGWTPNFLYQPALSIAVTASDGGASDTVNLTLRVSEIPPTPTFTSVATASFTADSGTQTFDVNSTAKGDDVVYSLVSPEGGPDVPSWLSINSSTGVISGAPDYTKTGQYSFTVRVTDGSVPADQAFTLNVENTLAFTSTNSHSVNENADISFNVQTDTEILAKSVAYSLGNYNGVDRPTWLSINASTGVLTASAQDTTVGDFSFKILASSSEGSAEQIFTLHVSNSAPTFSSASSTTFTEDAGAQTFDVNSSEEGQPGVSYSLVNAPDWLGIDQTTGVISGNPDDSGVGTHDFTVRVTEGTDNVNQSFRLTVANTLDFDSLDNGSVIEDQAFLFNVQTDTETGGVPVTYALSDNVAPRPDWISINSSTGVITANPDNTKVGEYSFKVTASSAQGNKEQIFTFTVTNDDPDFLNMETVITMAEYSGAQTFDVQNEDEGVSRIGSPYSITSFDGSETIPGWLSINAAKV